MSWRGGITKLAEASTGTVAGTAELMLNLARAYALAVDPARARSDDANFE